MNNPDGFSGVQLLLAGLGGAAIGAIGMAMSRPRTTQPAGGVLPAGQIGDVPWRQHGFYPSWDNDSSLAQFLGRSGLNCNSWSALPRDQKNWQAGLYVAIGQTLRESGPNYFLSSHNDQVARSQGPVFARAVDAYCLKMAIQAQNMPHAARPMPALTYR